MKHRKATAPLMTLLLTGILFAGILYACILLAGCGKSETASVLRVGGLKGPTSMGLLFLKEKAEKGEAEGTYEFEMVTAADELLADMIQGKLDIALLPANVASILYNKTEGGIAVIDINTLGVLYMVSGDKSLAAMEDLKGKTVYLTGKGTTPDYVLQSLLQGNGIAQGEVTLEYRSEAAEIAALLTEHPEAVGLLPQPFVTVATEGNKELQVVMDLNEQWEMLQGDKSMVTGVTVVRREVLETEKEAVDLFLKEHKESTEGIRKDVDKGAALTVAAEIIGKEPIARKAIPECNITYVDGREMKEALSAYLQVLYEQNPKAVGGSLPPEDFYYLP